MQKSIVLVTVDCLRADHVGFMGYGHRTTPFLDSLAKESFVFPTAIVAGAPTYYSFPAILASRYPLALGRDVIGLGRDEPTLATVLKQAGYATAAFGGANPYLSSRFGFDNGFDTFHNFLQEGEELTPPTARTAGRTAGNFPARLNRNLHQVASALGPLGVLYDELYFRYCQGITPPAKSMDALRRFPAADVIVDHACKWLSSIGDAPFFLWLHLMDPHAPYYPKEEALALLEREPITPSRARYLNSYWNRSDLDARRLARQREDVIGLYDAGIRWADEQVARLIATLRGSNAWENCIFAFTADHGEEFLDHGGRYHPPGVAEELIHVPLLVRVPAVAKQKVGNSPFSLLHLGPTLLDAADLPAPGDFRGQSHWRALQQGERFDDFAISECVADCTNPFRRENRSGSRVLSVRENRFKLVLHFDRAVENFYDLEADPGESSLLSATAQKPARRRLLEIAREHLQQSLERRDWKARLQARLRELQFEHRLEWGDPADKVSSVAS